MSESADLPFRPSPLPVAGKPTDPPAGTVPKMPPMPAASPVPAGAPVTGAAPLAAPKPKASEIAPPKVKSEGEQRRYLDVVHAAILKSAPDNPEGQKSAMRLAALYELMVTGTGVGESWGNRLSPVAAARLILFCGANGLDPSSNDVFILGDRPYLSLAGRSKLAFRSGAFEGFEVDRPMTAEERTLYAIPQDARSTWIALARRKDCKYGFLGTGYVGGDDRNPVAKQFPLDMAQKRARANALESAFPADVMVYASAEPSFVRAEVDEPKKPGELGTGAPATDTNRATSAESPAASPEASVPAPSETGGAS